MRMAAALTRDALARRSSRRREVALQLVSLSLACVTVVSGGPIAARVIAPAITSLMADASVLPSAQQTAARKCLSDSFGLGTTQVAIRSTPHNYFVSGMLRNGTEAAAALDNGSNAPPAFAAPRRPSLEHAGLVRSALSCHAGAINGRTASAPVTQEYD